MLKKKYYYTAPKCVITVLADPVAGGIVSGGGHFDYESIILISTTPNSGYNFVLWDDGCRELSRNIFITESKTYTAQYVNVPPPFVVTFNLNGHGTGSAPASLTLDLTTGFYASEPTEPTDSNFLFSGWFDNSACIGLRWSFTNDKVVKNTILYAKWVSTSEYNALILFFTDDIYNRALSSHAVGCIYSEDCNNPTTSTLIPYYGKGSQADSILCCTINENDVWSAPRIHLDMSDGFNHYKRGATCICRFYMNSVFESQYELVGLSISSINNGKLLPMQGIRKFDMPHGGGGTLQQVDCYYYEFTVIESQYFITPVFRAKTT